MIHNLLFIQCSKADKWTSFCQDSSLMKQFLFFCKKFSRGKKLSLLWSNLFTSSSKLTQKHKCVSSGDAGLQIKSLRIWIPSRLNLIIDFGPIWIWRQKLYRWSQFRSYFDLFSIKFDHFWSLFQLNLTTFRLKDQKRHL